MVSNVGKVSRATLFHNDRDLVAQKRLGSRSYEMLRSLSVFTKTMGNQAALSPNPAGLSQASSALFDYHDERNAGAFSTRAFTDRREGGGSGGCISF